MLIDKSERDDFNTILREHGFTEDKFQLSCRTDPLPSTSSRETGTVTVKYKKTAVERTYVAGYGTAWVLAVKKDLDAGSFLVSGERWGG